MGACSTTEKKTRVVTKEDQELDFETYRETVAKDNFNEEEGGRFIEIPANISEFIKHNNKSETQVLLSKYLFIKPSGKFKAVVGSKFGDMMFEGILDKNGVIHMTYKKQRQVIVENASSKIFEGKVEDQANLLSVKGNVQEDDASGRVVKEDTFLIDFALEKWVGSYELKGKLQRLNVYLKFDNQQVSGLGVDEIGLSLWSGTINENKITLSQCYLDKDESNADYSKNMFKYTGDLNSAQGKIEGTVTSKEIVTTEKTIFTLSKAHVVKKN